MILVETGEHLARLALVLRQGDLGIEIKIGRAHWLGVVEQAVARRALQSAAAGDAAAPAAWTAAPTAAEDFRHDIALVDAGFEPVDGAAVVGVEHGEISPRVVQQGVERDAPAAGRIDLPQPGLARIGQRFARPPLFASDAERLAGGTDEQGQPLWTAPRTPSALATRRAAAQGSAVWRAGHATGEQQGEADGGGGGGVLGVHRSGLRHGSGQSVAMMFHRRRSPAPV